MQRRFFDITAARVDKYSGLSRDYLDPTLSIFNFCQGNFCERKYKGRHIVIQQSNATLSGAYISSLNNVWIAAAFQFGLLFDQLDGSFHLGK